MDDPLSGSSFADRYVIEECVGEGGMGRVYRARHQRVSRKFAIKVLFGDCAAEPKTQDRFAREAEAASRLSHPNVVSVVDFGETEHGLLYLVMDWVEGSELWAVIAREAPFSRERVIGILRQLAEGLGHAHDKGLVHRDFKTENVILAREGGREVPKIVDFGIAVISETVEQGRLTTEGMVLGTPAYMAPEQATAESVDARTDLFALGVMTYEMMAGVLPFGGEGIDIARKNLAATPPAIAERVPGLEVDPALESIVFKLMEKQPERRFQSAADLVSELEALADGWAPGPGDLGLQEAGPEPGGAAADRDEEIARSPTARPVSRRRRAWAVAAVAAAFAGLSILGVLFFESRGGSPRAEVAKPEEPEVEPEIGAESELEAAAESEPEVEAEEPSEEAEEPDVSDEELEPPSEKEKGAREASPAPGATRRPKARIRRRGETAVRPKRPDGEKEQERGADEETAAEDSEKDERNPEEPEPNEREAITVDRLQALYLSVGRSIENLRRRRGGAAAESYQARYMDIPFAGALRNESLRREAYRKLVALRAAVRKELRR